jgi:hypothetical protein
MTVVPYKVGDIVRLTEEIDFRVKKMGTNWKPAPPPEFISWHWEARGKAIVHLPKDSINISIVEAVNGSGEVTNFSVLYSGCNGSKHAILVNRNWVVHDDKKGGWGACYLVVDSVDTEKG